MLDFFKRKKAPQNQEEGKFNTKEENSSQGSENKEVENKDPEQTSENKLTETKHSEKGLFERLKEKLHRSRSTFSDGLSRLFLGKKVIDSETLEGLEDLLLSSDIGVQATQEIIKNLTDKISRKDINDFTALNAALKQLLVDLLLPVEKPLIIPNDIKPYVILMVGVNGAGKTTTIGKLAKRLQLQGKTVLLAAGDTFRAAAVEQLKIWGERHNIPVISQAVGADSASVLFDAFQAAKARGVDVLIADTAGRLHTQSTLMDELKKIVRVMQKIDPAAPHEVMLVLDAGIGQNALNQTKSFYEAVAVKSLTLTKLDGTAKGGIIFNIAKTFNLPIRFVGVGEGSDDLRPFVAKDFVEALFASNTEESHDSI